MMEPGPELDGLVAEKVMGLSILWTEATPCPYCGAEMRYCGQRSRCIGCGEWRSSPYKEYSTDIAAAWEVVEKVRQDWPDQALEVGLCWEDEPQGWYCFVGFDEDEEGCGHISVAYGTTAPHTICLAALSAKGVELE